MIVVYAFQNGCELNFERGQAYIHYKKFYGIQNTYTRSMPPIIGSATAQRIIKKNSEAWGAFSS